MAEKTSNSNSRVLEGFGRSRSNIISVPMLPTIVVKTEVVAADVPCKLRTRREIMTTVIVGAKLAVNPRKSGAATSSRMEFSKFPLNAIRKYMSPSL